MRDNLALIPTFRHAKSLMDEFARKAGKTRRELWGVEMPSIRNRLRPVLAELLVVLITTTHDPVTGNTTEHRLLVSGWFVDEGDFQLATRISGLAKELLPPMSPRMPKIGLLLCGCQIKQGEHLVLFLRSKNAELLPQVPTLDLKCGGRRIQTVPTAYVASEELSCNSAGL